MQPEFNRIRYAIEETLEYYNIERIKSYMFYFADKQFSTFDIDEALDFTLRLHDRMNDEILETISNSIVGTQVYLLDALKNWINEKRIKNVSNILLQQKIDEYNVEEEVNFNMRIEREVNKFQQSPNFKLAHGEAYDAQIGNMGYITKGGVFIPFTEKQINKKFYCIEFYPKLIDTFYLMEYVKIVKRILDNFKRIVSTYLELQTDGKIANLAAESNEIHENLNKMKIFISHSHKDVEIAKGIIELLRGALNLKVEDIRCTSVDGYRLPAGISTDEQLRMEIHDSIILIGLISPASISSYYVLFELGARWGTNKPLIPLISSETGIDLLKGPLQGITALNAKEEGQLFQLISDIAAILEIAPENPQSYQVHIKKLVELTKSNNNDLPLISTDKLEDNGFDYSDSNNKIKNHCKNYWPNDFSMQVSCINEQQEAVKILKQGKPIDISEDDFILIRKKAEEDWPDDYSMRVSQEKEQYEAIKKLKTM